jgi:uncharacterized membrane protein YebE (DUF533 family)
VAEATEETDVGSEAGGPPEHDDNVVEILASKILIDWLRNRQQLLVPFTLDLQKLEPRQAETLLEAMVVAAQAHGPLTTADRERLSSALRLINATDEQHAAVEALTGHAKSLHEVLDDVSDVQEGALVYAASLLAIDRRKRVNRYYLRYLAARLELPRDLVRTLEQRFNSAL